jgi:hypothetical protein
MENQEDKPQRIYSRIKMDNFHNKLIKGNGDFLIRFGTECNELIFDNVHNIFSTGNNNFPSEMIYLFGMVQNDVKRFLNINPHINLPPIVNTIEYNHNYNDKIGTITATDLDHAYWRIALVKGYIREETYTRGLNPKAKALRLATLSTLGKGKVFDKYVNGKFLEKIVRKEPNQNLKNAYLDIRYSCYYMMYELSKILKDDFDCWKTDCIYYRDTPENRRIVHTYFEERGLLFKQLI